MISLTLCPHVERGVFDLDLFDAFLGDKLICTSRQPLFDGARALLERGVAPDTPLAIRHAGKDHDSFAPEPVSELAKWTYVENPRDGLQKVLWRPPEVAA